MAALPYLPNRLITRMKTKTIKTLLLAASLSAVSPFTLAASALSVIGHDGEPAEFGKNRTLRFSGQP
ncbi:hypothetical protein GCM10017655_43340 [Pseudomonas turukhanskensis]|uniref:Uncharacterized protein n=1 Tax=Pseudomonas turukhanskensis TaxID=1806536 RepID=A0A9W6NHU9_9PSED|nr:hypothetical protein GCM10017655_43340 [Pseudomonas turukhanskensis]